MCKLLLCAGPIEGSAVLAVRTVDTAAVDFGAWFVCAQKKSKFENKKFVVVCLELIIRPALSKKSTSPAVMFISRLALPSVMTWTDKSNTCVAKLPRSQ